MNRIKKLTIAIVRKIAKCCGSNSKGVRILRTIRNVEIKGKVTNIHIAALGTLHPKSGLRRMLLIYIDGFGGRIYLPLSKYVCTENGGIASAHSTSLTKKKNKMYLKFEHRVDNIDDSKLKYSSKHRCHLYTDSNRERILAKEIKDSLTPKNGNSYMLSYEFDIYKIINMGHPNLLVYDTNTIGLGGEIQLICLDGNGGNHSVVTEEFLDGLTNESDYRKLRKMVDTSPTPEHVSRKYVENILFETRRRISRQVGSEAA